MKLEIRFSRQFITAVAVLCFFTISGKAQNTFKAGQMKTPWGEKVTAQNAWQEYPRPQLVRTEWKNLNGLWDYAITPKGQSKPAGFDGKILVPYSVASSLSGVGKQVMPDQELWYKTKFSLPASWKNKRMLLHFDAVDWETHVWLNGSKVGSHRGGSDPFSFDVSKFVKAGDQELVISVWDPTDTGTQARGKQVLEPKGIWYTAVTGIWQTVWIEPVEPVHIEKLIPESNIDNSTVLLKNIVSGARGNEMLSVNVIKDGKRIQSVKGNANQDITIEIPDAALWTPENPQLYQLEVELLQGRKSVDKVKSYFAMRKIAIGKDADGFQRLYLNNKPVFQYGTLDQGWWPDGLLTPPSDEAMRFDMDMLKNMGFNMLRKHIKVEPSRYYYYADSIGLLVWQDMISGMKTDEMDVQYIKPGGKQDWGRPKESADQWESEWKNIMDHLRFFPSIVVWVPFNEGWGQYDTKRIVEWTKKYDPSRVVNGVSGWEDRNVGEMYDVHHYPGPGMEPGVQNPGRVIVLGEFGGLGLPMQDHLWNPDMRNWGYRTYQNSDILIKEYASLMYSLQPMIGRGLSAAIYTQTSDVEGEVNGLVTYDRKKVKIDPHLMRIFHQPLYGPYTKSRPLAEDAEINPGQLMVSNAMPAIEAFKPVARTGFRQQEAPLNLKKGEKRYILKSFELNDPVTNLQFRILANADVKVFLNGKKVLDKYINATRHYDEVNLSEYAGYSQKGENQLIIEITEVKGNSKFDAGLYTF